MKNVFVIVFFMMIFSCCNNHFSRDFVNKMVSRKRAEWRISKIDYKWQNFDYYSQSLYNCGINITSSNMRRANSFLLKFYNGKDVMIEIIEFPNPQLAKDVYLKTKENADLTRTTPRKNYDKLCQQFRDLDYHYVHLKGSRLFLIGCINGNFVFKNGDVNLETNISFLYETRLVYEYMFNEIE